MRGRMIWFNEAKGLGLIQTDDGERLRVHDTGFLPGSVPVGRCGNAPVSFMRVALDVEEGGYQAVGVSMLDETPARRARPRRHGAR